LKFSLVRRFSKAVTGKKQVFEIVFLLQINRVAVEGQEFKAKVNPASINLN
jgi:hypothetical protein